jgi:hypothetical protein
MRFPPFHGQAVSTRSSGEEAISTAGLDRSGTRLMPTNQTCQQRTLCYQGTESAFKKHHDDPPPECAAMGIQLYPIRRRGVLDKSNEVRCHTLIGGVTTPCRAQKPPIALVPSIFSLFICGHSHARVSSAEQYRSVCRWTPRTPWRPTRTLSAICGVRGRCPAPTRPPRRSRRRVAERSPRHPEEQPTRRWTTAAGAPSQVPTPHAPRQ